MAEFLLNKNYEVHGIKRRASLINNTARIDHIYEDIHKKGKRFFLHYGDLTDSSSIISIIQKIKPDEIYNLAAQSHVSVSFEIPEYTSDVNALGTLRILEAIRLLNMSKKIKFYQASTSELYGNTKKFLKMKKQNFILDHHMLYLNYLVIGLLKIIEKLMVFTRVMEFYLIMSLLEEEKHS